MTTREEIADREAAAAFDGPSTVEERLWYRIGADTYALHELALCEKPDAVIAKAREVIELASRIEGARSGN